MKLSEKNQLQGRVVEIKEGDVTAKVVLDIGDGRQITSEISMASLKGLNLRKGTIVSAIFDFTSVEIGVDEKNYSDCSLGCDA